MANTKIFKDYAEYWNYIKKHPDEKNINGCTKEFLERNNISIQKYRKWNEEHRNENCLNCYKCTDCYMCEDCIQCYNLKYSQMSNNCSSSKKLEYCNDCDTCKKCYGCKDCFRCEDSNFLNKCEDCKKCNHCYDCTKCTDSKWCAWCYNKNESIKQIDVDSIIINKTKKYF